MTGEELQYVRLKINNGSGYIYRVVDDKTIDGLQRLVLRIMDGKNYVGYVEVYPEEVEPVDRSKL